MAIAALALSATAPATARPDKPWPVILRAQAARLADVGFHIGRTAAPLCPVTAVGTGIALDYIEAYDAVDRPAVSRLLGLTEAPQVAAVAKNSPAAAAGILPGDAVLAINGANIASLRAASLAPALLADELEQRLADMPADAPIMLILVRAGKRVEARVMPVAVCAARFIIKVAPEVSAYTDGRNIAVTSGLIGFTRDDDELALVMGHETGHIIYRDGERDGAKGAERRAMEDQADVVSVQLVKCAGYDLEAALQYRLRRAASRPLEFLSLGDHRPSHTRAARMRRLVPSMTCPSF